MACFGFLLRFRRSGSSKSSTLESAAPPPHPHTSEYKHPEPQPSCFHEHAQRIVQIPVSGMRRNPGPGQTSCYIGTYQPAPSRGPYAGPGRIPGPSYARDGRAETFETDTTDDTLIGSAVDAEKKVGYAQDMNKSTWQGKVNGTAYDRREELTEEDEDMWARMAM